MSADDVTRMYPAGGGMGDAFATLAIPSGATSDVGVNSP